MDLMQGTGFNDASGFSLSGTLSVSVVVIKSHLQVLCSFYVISNVYAEKCPLKLCSLLLFANRKSTFAYS